VELLDAQYSREPLFGQVHSGIVQSSPDVLVFFTFASQRLCWKVQCPSLGGAQRLLGPLSHNEVPMWMDARQVQQTMITGWKRQ
jgi:hypothetical protein